MLCLTHSRPKLITRLQGPEAAAATALELLQSILVFRAPIKCPIPPTQSNPSGFGYWELSSVPTIAQRKTITRPNPMKANSITTSSKILWRTWFPPEWFSINPYPHHTQLWHRFVNTTLQKAHTHPQISAVCLWQSWRLIIKKGNLQWTLPILSNREETMRVESILCFGYLSHSTSIRSVQYPLLAGQAKQQTLGLLLWHVALCFTIRSHKQRQQTIV